MTTLTQIMSGTLVLILCSLVHVVILVWSVGLLGKLGRLTLRFGPDLHRGSMIGTMFMIVVFSHTVQVWIWAAAFLIRGALTDFGQSIYFSLVTYTTLGYGDVTLATDFQVFGAMAAVTGLLTFGLSTAFLAGLLARLLPRASRS